MAVMRSTLTYGCEVWTTTSIIERRLRTFENEIRMIICGLIYDNENGMWRKQFIKELQEETGMVSFISVIKKIKVLVIGTLDAKKRG